VESCTALAEDGTGRIQVIRAPRLERPALAAVMPLPLASNG
jgi:hypothetical protein